MSCAAWASPTTCRGRECSPQSTQVVLSLCRSFLTLFSWRRAIGSVDEYICCRCKVLAIHCDLLCDSHRNNEKVCFRKYVVSVFPSFCFLSLLLQYRINKDYFNRIYTPERKKKNLGALLWVFFGDVFSGDVIKKGYEYGTVFFAPKSMIVIRSEFECALAQTYIYAMRAGNKN